MIVVGMVPFCLVDVLEVLAESEVEALVPTEEVHEGAESESEPEWSSSSSWSKLNCSKVVPPWSGWCVASHAAEMVFSATSDQVDHAKSMSAFAKACWKMSQEGGGAKCRKMQSRSSSSSLAV